MGAQHSRRLLVKGYGHNADDVLILPCDKNFGVAILVKVASNRLEPERKNKGTLPGHPIFGLLP